MHMAQSREVTPPASFRQFVPSGLLTGSHAIKNGGGVKVALSPRARWSGQVIDDPNREDGIIFVPPLPTGSFYHWKGEWHGQEEEEE